MVLDHTIKAQSIVQESIIGADDRQQVGDTQQNPWNKIGLLTLRFPDGSSAGGSGALIDPYHILTAGHVVYEKQKGGWATVKSIDVSLGQNGINRYYGTAKATQIRSFKGWTVDGSAKDDMAVITLDRNIGNFAGWFGYRAETNAGLNRTIVNLAGYPDDKAVDFFGTGTGISDVRMYTASGTIRTATDNQLFYGNTLDTNSGESGAPVWKYFPSTGEQRIVGVHTDGGPKSNFGSRLTLSKFQAIQSWINSDNVSLKPIDRPDLVDYDAWFRTKSANLTVAGGQFSLNAFVRNNGTAPANRFQVSFYASSDATITPEDYKLGDVVVNSLNPFQWTKVSLQGDRYQLPTGSYFFGWQIDSSNTQAEFSETNNTGLLNQADLIYRQRKSRHFDTLTGLHRGQAIAGKDKTFKTLTKKATAGISQESTQLHFGSNRLNPQHPTLRPQLDEGLIGNSQVHSQLQPNPLQKFFSTSGDNTLSAMMQSHTPSAIHPH